MHIFQMPRIKPPKKAPWLENPAKWATMNEGNRRYAYEQWSLSLIRRGIKVSHPFPGEDEIDHISETGPEPIESK